MAKKVWDNPIDKNTDWGGDETTGNLPVAGSRVQEFIKNTFNNKAGFFYYDTANNRYLVFADSESKDKYLEDPTQLDLVLGNFDAPFNYTAEINLTSPNYVAVLLGSIGNYIDFTFDTKNKQGQSVGEDVVCTFQFIHNSVKKVVNQQYRYGTAVHFNIDEYLESGSNTIIIGIVGQNTLAATTVSVTYQVVDLSIVDTMNISDVYNLNEDPDSNIIIPYTVSGSGTKIMEWYIDGEQLPFVKDEDEILGIEVSKTKYISISGLSEGRHNLQFRAYTTVNGDKFYSPILYRDFIVYKLESLNNIIAIAANLLIGSDIVTGGDLRLTGIAQYEPYDLRFGVFNPSSSTTNVDILIDDSVTASLLAENYQENTYSLVFTSSGEKTIKILTSTSEYSLPVVVDESDTSLEEITDGLQLDLNSIGKSNNAVDKDIWRYGEYSTTFNGFSWNKVSGWVNNRLLISKGASISVNIKPLEVDSLILGKTLEFEFATKNVSNDEAVVCDLTNQNGVGLIITASEVRLQSSGGAKVTTKYKSEESLRVSLVINKKSGSTNKLLAFIYINGVISGAVNFSSTDNFISDKELVFASSEEADIELKQIRIYDAALTSDQILNNYILYRDSAAELLSLYDRNNILSEDGYSFSTDILSGQLPVMIVTGNIPYLENTTDKNLEITVDVDYINLQDPSRSFKIKNGVMRPQGTSSMSYPKKNFRLYTRRKDNTILYDSNGNVVADKLYSFKENAQPVDCWCMKADYAESSGTHNTGIARLWNQVMKDARVDGEYVCRTEAQNKAIENNYKYDVRTTVDGFPIVMFYRLTENDDLVFIGKYNFNNDKSTESVFGFKDIPGFDNSRMQCWEVLNNGNHLALFQDVDGFDSEWQDAFEARYPDVGEDADITDLKAFATWLVSTKDNHEKFKLEKAEHLDLYKMAAYYVYFMRFGAVDQTVKNAMFTSEDGQHFYYINYDNDTINGLRNDGLLVYPPTMDRQTLDPSFSTTVYAYAGHESTLWNMLEADEEFMSMVSVVDDALFTAGLSYVNVIKMFDNEQCDKWNERVFNQDAQYKYIGPWVDSGVNNLYMLQGKRQAHRRWWLSRRFNFLDSKFVSGDYKASSFEIKMAGAPSGIEFSITAGFDMNYGYGVNNVPVETGVQLTNGQSHTFTTKQVLNIGDPLRIYSSVNIKEIDVHNFIEYLSTISVDKVYSEVLGTQLKKLVIGVDVSSDTRRNSSIREISGLKMAKRLEYLDISGFEGITYLDLTEFDYFKTLKAFGSGLTSVSFAEGASLQLAELPSTLQALTLSGVSISVSNLKIENTWANLRYIEIINCENFKTNFSYFQKWYREKTASNNECTLIVEGISWNNISDSDLIELGQLKVDGGTLLLKGKIRLNETSEESVNTLREIFGANCFNPSNDLYISAPDAIYITGPSEIYEGDTAQYSAAVFSDYRGEVTYAIVSGNDGSFTINENTGLLTSVEKGRSTSITIRVIHRPTQGVSTTKDLVVTVKARIYPNVTIVGEGNVNQQYQIYEASFSPSEYNGVFSLSWELTGDAKDQGLIRISSRSSTECTIEMIGVVTEPVEAVLTAIMHKSYGTTVRFTKNLSVVQEGVILTSTSNPVVMGICYAHGWSVSPDMMTEDEAAAVSSIGQVFANNQELVTFTELQYFTGLTSIGEMSFAGCNNLRSITLPSTITSIGQAAFLSCRSLITIIIPDGVTTIDQYAFQTCKGLISAGLPNTLTSIGQYAFDGCTSLLSITLPNNVTTLGNYAFKGCSVLRSVTLSTSLSILNVSVFRGCTSLTSIIIPEGVTTINSYAFDGCTSLTEATLPSTLTYIASTTCFNNCPNLERFLGSSEVVSSDNRCIILKGVLEYGILSDVTEYIIPDGVTKIGYGVFRNCTLLQKVTLPSTLITLDQYAFYGTSLTSIIIPEGVTTIDSYAFGSCTSLTEVTLPSTLTSVYGSSFQSCINLERFLGSSEVVSSDNRCIVISGKLFGFAPKGITEYTIPEGVTTINSYAFGSCTSLTSIVIPEGVTSIGNSGFSGCTSLTSVNLPSTLTTMGQYAFYHCTSLTSIVIPDGVTTINSYALDSCTSLTEVTLPSTITSIGQAAFSGCTSLTSIVIPEGVTSIGNAVFNGCTSLTEITCKASIAPTVSSMTFGSQTIYYTGRNTYNQGINKLYVPSESTGYDESYWGSVLLDSTKCGFTLSKTL